MKVTNIKTPWVVDISFILPLFLPDEASGDADGFLNVAFEGHTTIFIPSLWWFEMSNSLHIAVKRQRLSHEESLNAINIGQTIVGNFFKVEPVTLNTTLYELAHEHNLTAYDASYLDLALRHQAGLASLDKQLNSVAKQLGIETWK